MWLSATEGVEKHNAVEKALPKIEQLTGEKLAVSNVMELIGNELDKIQKPLPGGDWLEVDWNKRAEELAQYVPQLYLSAVERIGADELERRKQERQAHLEWWRENVPCTMYEE